MAEVEEKARGVESEKVSSVLSENSKRGGHGLSFIEFPYDSHCGSITARIWRLESQPSCDTTSFLSYVFPDIKPLA